MLAPPLCPALNGLFVGASQHSRRILAGEVVFPSNPFSDDWFLFPNNSSSGSPKAVGLFTALKRKINEQIKLVRSEERGEWNGREGFFSDQNGRSVAKAGSITSDKQDS